MMLANAKMQLFLFVLFALVFTITGQHNSNQLESRSVIAQMFEWKFSDIATECEQWLGPKGYGAVQISPVNEHLVFEGRPWWERYQPISYKIFSRSGNEEELLNMTRRCNSAGVRVYADVVLNHMAGENPEPVTGTADSTADPKKYLYPGVPYKRSHFNKPCEIKNWNDPFDLRNCQISGLRDLNMTQEYVREKIVTYLNHLIELGVGGFRLDAAKHMWPSDLEVIFSRVNDLNEEFGFEKGARPFIIHEVVDFGSMKGDVGRWEYQHLGKITDFMPPGEIGRAFRGYNHLKYLRNWGPQWNFLPSDLAVVFLADHEIQRGTGLGGADILTYPEYKLFKMGSAWLLGHPYGTPRILTSYNYADMNQGPPRDMFDEILSPEIGLDNGCSNGWICEHRWRSIANMVGFRNAAHRTHLSNWWDNNMKQISFSRGDRGFIAWNGQQKKDFNWKLQTCLPAGIYCDVITGERFNGKCTAGFVEVDEDGTARIFIGAESDDGVLAIHAGLESTLNNHSHRQTLKKLLSRYWTTTCYRNQKTYIKHFN